MPQHDDKSPAWRKWTKDGKVYEWNPQAYKYEPAAPLPDISGVTVSADPRVNPRSGRRRGMVNITAIALAARAADNIPEPRRNMAQRMNRAAWLLGWRCIKRNDPGLAALLQDPMAQALVETFNAEIEIDAERFKQDPAGRRQSAA